jgi:hypothetical protein
MSNRMVVYENEYATLWYYPDAGIVHHQIHKYTYGPHFRELMLEGLRIFKERQATKWLSDDRENSALPKADAEWALTNWRPFVIKAGWKYWAIVMPKKQIGQMNMKQLGSELAAQGITVNAFTTPEEALEWLIPQP